MTHDAKPAVVGSKEYVDFPALEISGVPARIDTGAHKSAIWASNIHLEDGKLVFHLFAPGSAFYRDEPIVTTEYKTTVVRNSFGTKEFRYVTRLRVRLGGHTLLRWFTLADRSKNSYPVLLGRNFLRNTFVVNVADTYVHGSVRECARVCVLTRYPKAMAEFFTNVQRANQASVDYAPTTYGALAFYLDGRRTRVINTTDNTDLADYDYVYFKQRDLEPATAMATYLSFKGRDFADRELATAVSDSKLSEYMKLACYGIPVPPVIAAKRAVLRTKYQEITETLGVPFVLKAATGDRGRDNYLIDNEADFSRILQAGDKGTFWLAQHFVPNDGFYRILILKNEIALAIWRGTVEHENRLKRHLNKPGSGVNAVNVPPSSLPEAVRELSLRAATFMDRQIAGVDLLQDKQTGTWYILEVNSGPQIRSGAFSPERAEAVAKFFDNVLG